MRTSRLTILATAAIVAAVASAWAVTPATARDSDTHILLVQLPNGAVEQIEYTGDVAPQFAVPSIAPVPASAAMDQMMALMDRQAATMMQQIADMPAWAGQMPNLPPGTTGYSVMTTFTSNGVCTRSTHTTYSGGNAAPQTVSHVSGDCDTAPDHTTPAEMPAPHTIPHTIQVKANPQPHTYELASR